MLETIGSLLPAAAGIGLSPFPIIAVVLLLGTTRGTANGLAFLGGWLIGLGALTAIIVALVGEANRASDTTPTAMAWLRVLLGVALLALAAKKLLAASTHEGPPPTPGWMAGLDDATPGRAFGIGLLLGGANPKNVAFTLGAVPTIATIGLSSERVIAVSALYVLLASSMLLLMVTAQLVARSASESVLRGIERFMLAHSAAITVIILALIGAKLIGDGLAVI